MTLRARSFTALAILLFACAPKTASQPSPVVEPQPSLASDLPQTSAPEPAAAPPSAFEPPPVPLVWDKEVERAPLPGGQGMIVLGASACEAGRRALLLRREKGAAKPEQTDLDSSTGCDFSREGKGWSTSDPEDEADEIRLQLGSVALDPKTVAIVLDIQGAGGEDRLVLSRGDTLLLVQSGRLSDSSTDLVLSQGRLTQVLRSDGSRDFMWHGAYGITVDADGGLVSTPREVSMARTKTLGDWKEAAEAKTTLVASCPKAANRIALLDVVKEDGDGEYWLGVPTLTYADASAAVRELKACGQAATVATRPAPKDP